MSTPCACRPKVRTSSPSSSSAAIPGSSLGVKKERADKIKAVADLKGAKIGVTAPGSSTNMIVWYLMAKAGLKPDDASFIGVGTGAGAVAAIQRAKSMPSPTSIR
jgi:ABC-type nitrate/sulfonate/bicarbonate transport system substrate-binding protein